MQQRTNGSQPDGELGPVGPVLFLRGADAAQVDLAALVLSRPDAPPGDLVTEAGPARAERLAERCGLVAHRFRFSLPARGDAWYELGGQRFEVDTRFGGDLRLAYVSCNGLESGDLERDPAERNVMWARLRAQHGDRPLNLLLHGGDQIYADELTEAHPASRGWPTDIPGHLDPETEADLATALRDAFFRRYAALYAQDEFSWLAARVPSLAMWDDHDICDGWGSLAPEALDSDVGRTLFAAAREALLLFQFATAPGEVPEICRDREGRSLTWHVPLPGLDLVAPDLRSERRPDRIMGPRGWEVFRRLLAGLSAPRTLLLSSVPVLGPRLSLLERAMLATPWIEEYEDDLRDQWQSRFHRAEWQDLLRALVALHDRRDREVTVLSGEIHLATRGTMATGSGPIHQLVASGIAHPAPPKAWARALGTLARLGEAPLKGHKIRLHPLPNRRGIYAAEKNYLLLERRGPDWTATWDLESTGLTPPLTI